MLHYAVTVPPQWRSTSGLQAEWGAVVPNRSCSPFWRKLQYPREFFNKGLLLNVSGHLKGYVGHFLPVGLEEGSTSPKCLMCDVQ